MKPGGGVALVVATLALAMGATPAGAVSKSSWQVPVTQPDEHGGAVTIDTDVYLPDGSAPAGGWPLVAVFHGGGSSKDSEYDAGHARTFAEHGYASLIYSARGHGNSGGQTSVAGPKEMRDTFDVLHWALQKFPLDASRIGLTGYSQGGLNTNLAQAWSTDPTLNPYGIRFVVTEPGNTPDVVFNALVPNQVVKLSFGVGLIGTYAQGAQGRVAPIVDKWIATTSADQPGLYGGDLCDLTGHDSDGSTMKADLAARSIGCLADRDTVPWLWAQAFDDELFTAQMAIAMLGRGLRPDNRLYLSMGGHAAPAAPPEVERDKLDAQIAYLDHVLRRAPLELPLVTYWTRDTAVAVPGNASAWPLRAWYRQTSDRWPPTAVSGVRYRLGADGRAVESGKAADGSLRLAPTSGDTSDDPVARALLGSAPVGTSPGESPPSTSSPGAVASFATPPFAADRELSGSPSTVLRWTPSSPDTQVVFKLFDVAPDGTLTFLTRGVQGLRGATTSQTQSVAIEANAISVLVRRGHHLLAAIAAGDASFYKAYPGSSGGTLEAGDQSALTLPLRDPARSGRPGGTGGAGGGAGGAGCRDRTRPTARIVSLRRRGHALLVRGRASDRACGRAARVRRVRVAVARLGGGRCRFLTPRGRFTRARSCRRPAYVRPRGTRAFRLRVRGLPAGRYRVLVRAVDRAGNASRASGRGAVRRLRVI